MSIHIEFIGLPGSGKSTYLREMQRIIYKDTTYIPYKLYDAACLSISRSINNKYISKFSNLFPAKLMMRVFGNPLIKTRYQNDALKKFIVENSLLFQQIVEYQVKREYTNSQKYADLSYMFRLFSMYQLAHDKLSNREVLLIDEGFGYLPVRTISYSSVVDERDIIAYTEIMPKPDILFNVMSTPEMADYRNRLRSKGYPGTWGERSYAERIEFLNLHQKYIDLIIFHLERCGLKVFSIDSMNDIGLVRKQLQNDVLTILN